MVHEDEKVLIEKVTDILRCSKTKLRQSLVFFVESMHDEFLHPLTPEKAPHNKHKTKPTLHK